MDLLQGPNLASIEEMAEYSGLKIIASGGVSSVENIKALKEMESLGVSGAIIGKALYEGKISLEEALSRCPIRICRPKGGPQCWPKE